MDLGPQGGPIEHFTAETWICRDLCDHTPWPFPDKSIDFCVCSHTLEDLRDPLWLCHEMIRVAKRGYIEVPSMAFELSRGREPGVPVGLSHHKWIVDIREAEITFIPKLHFVHGDRRLSLPASFGGSLTPDRLVSWLFWRTPSPTRKAGSLARPWPRRSVPSAPSRNRPTIRWNSIACVSCSPRPNASWPRRERGTGHGARIDPVSGPRPRVGMARRLHALSERHPRLARLVRKGLPAA